jgi:predicted small secreted protein
MKRIKRTAICLVLLVLGMTVYTGCRTAHGFGEDMEKAGDSIQRGTDK